MSFSQGFGDGLSTLVNNEATNTIPQFTAVVLDTLGPPNGAKRSDGSNAGPVGGINLSNGTDSTGGNTANVQPAGVMRIRHFGVCPGLIANGITVVFGDKLYTTSALQGALTNNASGAKFVGYALETTAGGAADIIAVKVAALCGT